MNVALAYVYPQVNAREFLVPAQRFASTYLWSKPKKPHQLHVVFNGPPPNAASLRALDGLDYQPHEHNNDGWDIGAFQMLGDSLDCDLLICMGTHIHFHRPNWLEMMVGSYIQNGPGLYGCWAYLSPDWHVRTTCFWCPPQILQAYPNRVGSRRSSRYEFEHGNNSLTRFVLSAGLGCWMVTWSGIYPFDQWENHAPGVDDSLVLDQHIHR